MGYQKIKVPAQGSKITIQSNGKISVPDNPIVNYIEGDGVGPDIWNISHGIRRCS